MFLISLIGLLLVVVSFAIEDKVISLLMSLTGASVNLIVLGFMLGSGSMSEWPNEVDLFMQSMPAHIRLIVFGGIAMVSIVGMPFLMIAAKKKS